MQGIHEGTEAMPLPTLLAAVPFISCTTVSAPAPVQQHVPSALSCSPSSLCFLLYCLTHRHNRTLSALSSQRNLLLQRWLLYMDVSLCCSPAMRWQQWCISFFILFPIICFLSVDSRLHVWMHNIATQTNILFLHPSHYLFAEGFAALLNVLLLYHCSIQYKTLLNIASNTAHL